MMQRGQFKKGGDWTNLMNIKTYLISSMIDTPCLREWPKTQKKWREWTFFFKWAILSWICLDIQTWRMWCPRVIDHMKTSWCINIKIMEKLRKKQKWKERRQLNSSLQLALQAPRARAAHSTTTFWTWGSNCTSRTSQSNRTWLTNCLPSWCLSSLEDHQDCAWKITC